MHTYIFIGKSMIMLMNARTNDIPFPLRSSRVYHAPTTLVLRQCRSY